MTLQKKTFVQQIVLSVFSYKVERFTSQRQDCFNALIIYVNQESYFMNGLSCAVNLSFLNFSKGESKRHMISIFHHKFLKPLYEQSITYLFIVNLANLHSVAAPLVEDATLLSPLPAMFSSRRLFLASGPLVDRSCASSAILPTKR